jgi:hypothetical protein
LKSISRKTLLPPDGLEAPIIIPYALGGGHKLVDALHGGGSPVIEKAGIYRRKWPELKQILFSNPGKMPLTQFFRKFFY